MIYADVDEQGQRELMQTMKETKEKKWYRRLKIIDLSGQHFSVPSLAIIFNLSPHTIRTYIQRYNSGGIEKLKPGYGKGRDLALDWSKDEWLVLFGQAPSQFEQLHSGAQNWTQELMMQYLAMYEGVTVTQPAISTMLKRVGLKWKRAKQRIKSPDPLYIVKRQRVDSLKEKAQTGTLSSREATHPPPEPAKPGLLFYLDSTDLHWCPDPGQAYAEVGKQLKVDTPGHDNPWLALFGSLAFPSGEGLYSIHEHKRHQELIYHLQLLMNTYPDHFLFIVLDNASAHTTSKVDSFCAAYPNQIELVFLPTYSPHLNLIERLWRVLRHQVTRNQFFDSLDLLATAVVNWFEQYPLPKFCSLMGVDESQLLFV
jgi:transposase